MTKQNKDPQDVRKHRLVDIAKVYTPSELAEHIGVARQYIYDMIKAGIIKPEDVITRKKYTIIIWDDKDHIDDRKYNWGYRKGNSKVA